MYQEIKSGHLQILLFLPILLLTIIRMDIFIFPGLQFIKTPIYLKLVASYLNS